MTKQEAIRRLYGLIADINTEEVADHIKSGVSLQDWTNLWRCEAKDVLRVLEGKADTPQTDKDTFVIDMALVECKARHKGCKNCDKECMWRDEPQTDCEQGESSPYKEGTNETD